ncbi:hypothetical protein AB4Z40_31970 [Bosea sp. 2YAB26]|uniref:hypothetical protein n=1 Tax=Bosea sp. 2YAB26 TaxID=3237478 RepID=UPI003F903C21
MDRQELEDILDERGIKPRPDHDDDRPEMLMPVRQFKAFNTSGNPVEVIGVGYFNEMLQFLVIEEGDGEIWPIFRENVFKDQQSAPGAIHSNGAP